MAKRKATAEAAVEPTPIEPPAPQVAEAPASAPISETQPPEERSTTAYPDPRPQKSLSLGVGKDAPKLRLLRSFRFNQMQIRSDEELPELARKQLTAAGWIERPQEGIWTKQLPSRKHAEGDEPKHAWPAVIEAERLFADLADNIRADKQLPPHAQESSR